VADGAAGVGAGDARRGGAPAAPADVDHSYRTGLGDLLVDLRHVAAPAGSVVPLRIDSGRGRTVVVLPRDRCFNLDIRTARPERGRSPHRSSTRSSPGRRSTAAGCAAAGTGGARAAIRARRR
jgi:hypothetical protein